MNQIMIYQTADNQTQIEVQFEQDTVWLTQQQMGVLFNQTKQNISLHIGNCFKEGELTKNSVVKDSLTTASDGKKYKTKYYNLDVTISVGYRVKSKQGTRFRIWVTQCLKEHLVQGYSINKNRLEQLQQTVELVQKTAANETSLSEAKGLLDIITHYTQSFVLLNQYDSNSIETHKLNEGITYEIAYGEAKQAITELKKQLMSKKEATELFGNEKDDSFKSSLRSIVQTFGGQYLFRA